MKIYLVRHAESHWQVDPGGVWDGGLTANGHEQARRLGAWLARQERVDANLHIEVASVVCSSLQRARETATVIAESIDLPIIVDEHLNEPEFHVSDHLPPCTGPMPTAALGRPSDRYLEFRSQVRDALVRLVQQVEQAGGPVMAVTHGGVIKTLLRLVIGSDLVTFRVYNAAISLIEWEQERWNVVFLNLSDHLSAELRTR